MSKQLRKLGRLDDISLNITKDIVSKCLDDLVDVEEHDVHRVALKRPHGILDDEWVVTVRWHEQCDSSNRIDGSPVQ